MNNGGGTKTVMIDPYAGTGVRELYKQLTGFASPFIGQGLTPYQGQIYPGASDLQQQGFGAAGGLTPLSQAGMGYFGNVLSGTDPMAAQGYEQMASQGLQNVMQPFDPSMVSQVMQPAQDLAMQNYQQNVVPYIMERYGAGANAKNAGAMWSELGKQGANMSLGLSNQMAQYLYPAWQNQLGRQQQGVGQAMQLSQIPGQTLSQAGQIGGMGADLLGQQMNIGGVQRDITGQGMQEQYQKYQQAQPYNNPYLQMAMNLLSQGASMPMQVGQQQQGPGMASLLPGLGSFLGSETGSSMLGSALGGIGGLLGMGGGAGMTAAGLGAMTPLGATGLIGPAGLSGLGAATLALLPMISDKRLKENIQKIDNALEKLEKIEGKTFTFKETKEESAGLIAQDVENVLPEAVGESAGYKYINYSGVIGLLVNAVKELNDKVNQIMPELN